MKFGYVKKEETKVEYKCKGEIRSKSEGEDATVITSSISILIS